MDGYYDFLNKILTYCEEHHIRPGRFESEAGLSKGQISHWKKGRFLPSRKSQEKISAVMGITIDALMHKTYEELYGTPSDAAIRPEAGAAGTIPVAKYVPVYQDPPCGIAEPYTSIYEIPLAECELGNADDCYAFIMGDSAMSPMVDPGDVVIVKKDPDPDTGDVVVVNVPGERSMLRTLFRTAEGIILEPINKHYSPIWYSNEEMQLLPVFFGGKVVRIHRNIRSSAHSVPEDTIM